jgi:hypothetical protein
MKIKFSKLEIGDGFKTIENGETYYKVGYKMARLSNGAKFLIISSREVIKVEK